MNEPRLPDLTNQRALATSADRLINLVLHGGPALMRKAAVTSIGPGDFASLTTDPDAQPLVSEIRRRSVIGQLPGLGSMTIGPLQNFPGSGDDPEPAWVSEGAPAPVGRLSTTNLYTSPTSYMLLLVILKELVRLGDGRARNYVLSRLRRAAVRADDRVFLGTAAASAAQPAGILWNRIAVGGGSPGDLSLEELVASVSGGDPIAPIFVHSARGGAFLAESGILAFRDTGLMGGKIAGAPALVSPAAGDNLILIDAAEIAISDDGLEIATSQQAAIEMRDDPTNNSVTATAAALVSAFQVNAAVLRLVRYLSWVLQREDAVAFVELPIGGSPA